MSDLVDAVTADEVNEVLDWVDCAGVTAFANDVIAKLSDLTALGNAITSGDAVVSYDAKFLPWDIEVEHVKDGDYFTVNVLANEDNAKEQTISIYVDDSKGLGKLLTKLGEIVTIDAGVELKSLDYNPESKNVEVVGGGYADVVVDMREDPNYAVVMGVMLAEGVQDTAKREALVEGIKTWYEHGVVMADLKAAFENLTLTEVVKVFDIELVDFDGMLEDLGLTGVVGDEAKALYNDYELLFKAVYKVGKKVIDNREKFNIDYVLDYFGLSEIADDENNRLHNEYVYLSSLETRIKNKLNSVKDDLVGKYETDEYGTYGKTTGRHNVTKSHDVFRKYGLTVNADVTKLSLLVKIFKPD